jgi:hypothetical protein
LWLAGFFLVRRRDKNGHWGWPDLSPWLLWWIAATPSGQIYLSFFFFLFAGKFIEGGRKMAVGGGVRRRRWAVGYLFGGLIC